MPAQNDKLKKFLTFIGNNIVTVVFVVFVLVGFFITDDISLNYFINQLFESVFRNTFLVLSLIIPVIAGLGMNFGIVVGALSAQLALVLVRYFDIPGIWSLLVCIAVSLPLAMLFGYFTGKLYNKTRGQEMIAGLIVGFFADGVYYFILLFAIGVIIPVALTNPLVNPSGIGIRGTVDMGAFKYSLDGIMRIPFMTAALIVALCVLAWLVWQHMQRKKNPALTAPNKWLQLTYVALCLFLVGLSVFAMATGSNLMKLRQVPVITALVIVLLCVFTQFLLKTKLGQDFRSVGQSQHIAQASGINVDRTRIIAVILSTVLAAWGMLIYLQNMGTLATYDAHRQIGMFSVASLLVGGASTSKANVKNALVGVVLFNAMFIVSPSIGLTLFGDSLYGEYFRTFMVYAVIGVALGLYVWRAHKAAQQKIE